MLVIVQIRDILCALGRISNACICTKIDFLLHVNLLYTAVAIEQIAVLCEISVYHEGIKVILCMLHREMFFFSWICGPICGS